MPTLCYHANGRNMLGPTMLRPFTWAFRIIVNRLFDYFLRMQLIRRTEYLNKILQFLTCSETQNDRVCLYKYRSHFLDNQAKIALSPNISPGALVLSAENGIFRYTNLLPTLPPPNVPQAMGMHTRPPHTTVLRHLGE